jgi:hypothetical protein
VIVSCSVSQPYAPLLRSDSLLPKQGLVKKIIPRPIFLNPLTEEPDVPHTSQIPLFDSGTQVAPPLDPEAYATPDQVLIVVESVTTDEGGRALQGLYPTAVASGETPRYSG